MTRQTMLLTIFAGAAAGAAALGSAAVASADDTNAQSQQYLGSPATVDGGDQTWTVTGLRPSADTIDNFHPAGTLWEASATNISIDGTNIPFVPGFAATTSTGDTYPTLWGVATSEGVNPAPLAQGESVTGKLYFDVTGQAPTHVVYAAGDDLTEWTVPAPGPDPQSGGQQARTPQRWTPAPAPAGPAGAPAATSQGTPAPASQSAAAPASQGTPAPATGSSGTPLTATPTPTPSATPAPTATAATPTATPSTPAAGGAPQSAAPAPAAGSSGTPIITPAATATAAPAPR